METASWLATFVLLVGALASHVRAKEEQGLQRERYRILALCLMSWGLAGGGFFRRRDYLECTASETWSHLVITVAVVVGIFLLARISTLVRMIRRKPRRPAEPAPFGRPGTAIVSMVGLAIPLAAATFGVLGQFACG